MTRVVTISRDELSTELSGESGKRSVLGHYLRAVGVPDGDLQVVTGPAQLFNECEMRPECLAELGWLCFRHPPGTETWLEENVVSWIEQESEILVRKPKGWATEDRLMRLFSERADTKIEFVGTYAAPSGMSAPGAPVWTQVMPTAKGHYWLSKRDIYGKWEDPFVVSVDPDEFGPSIWCGDMPYDPRDLKDAFWAPCVHPPLLHTGPEKSGEG